MFEPGTQVVYVPAHVGVAQDKSTYGEPGVEFGFVTENRGRLQSVFVRYWRPGQEGRSLRTTANSELTPLDCLAEHRCVPQAVVDTFMEQLGIGSEVMDDPGDYRGDPGDYRGHENGDEEVGFAFDDMGLVVHGSPTWERWYLECGELQVLWQRTPLALGDMLVYGEQRWGERYAEAISVTGLAVQTLMNYRSICARFPRAERKPGLTIGHYAALQHLDDLQAKGWARAASENEWTRQDLTDALAARNASPEKPLRFGLRLTADEVLALCEALDAIGPRDARAQEVRSRLEVLRIRSEEAHERAMAV